MTVAREYRTYDVSEQLSEGAVARECLNDFSIVGAGKECPAGVWVVTGECGPRGSIVGAVARECLTHFSVVGWGKEYTRLRRTPDQECGTRGSIVRAGKEYPTALGTPRSWKTGG